MPKSGKPKGAKRPPRIALVIKTNIEALLDYAGRRPELADRATPVALETFIRKQAWGESVGKSSIYRMTEGKSATGADVLDMVARAFDLQAWQLLMPGFDPGNPPSLLISDSQRELFKNFQESARAFVQSEAKNEKSRSGTAGTDRDNEGEESRERDLKSGGRRKKAKPKV